MFSGTDLEDLSNSSRKLKRSHAVALFDSDQADEASVTEDEDEDDPAPVIKQEPKGKRKVANRISNGNQGLEDSDSCEPPADIVLPDVHAKKGKGKLVAPTRADIVKQRGGSGGHSAVLDAVDALSGDKPISPVKRKAPEQADDHPAIKKKGKSLFAAENLMLQLT